MSQAVLENLLLPPGAGLALRFCRHRQLEGEAPLCHCGGSRIFECQAREHRSLCESARNMLECPGRFSHDHILAGRSSCREYCVKLKGDIVCK